MPREKPPLGGTLKIEVPCDRRYRGALVGALTNTINSLPETSPRLELLQRLNEAVAAAPWVAKVPPPRVPEAAGMGTSDGLGA